MPWYSPTSWFSRAQAMNAKNNANTAILKSALTNYIKAVNSLKPNMRTKQAITNILNQANANANNKRVIRNRLANGVAAAVFAAKKANVAVAAANAGAVSETAAATHVNNAAKQINNLKNKVEASSGAAAVPYPKGLGGVIHGVTQGKNQNNSGENVNRNYVLAILKNNNKYKTNRNKINAIIAYNPGLNFSKLARNNNNNKIKKLLANANSIKKFKNVAPAQRLNNTLKAAGNNNNTLTGNMFKQANNAAAQTPASKFNQNLRNELSKTAINKLKSNITNNAQANALATRVRNAARAAGKNENQNVKNALARINAHKNSLTKKN